MLGSIAGDICGSPYEGGSCAPARFKLFTDGCCFTDDTVCTIAVADALLSDGDFAAALRRWVSRYPGRGYGGLFINWATSTKGPYILVNRPGLVLARGVVRSGKRGSLVQ